MTTTEPTPDEKLAQAQTELRDAERTVHALRDSHSHIRSAQIALRDLPADTWVTLTAKALELALLAADTDLGAAQAVRRMRDRLATDAWQEANNASLRTIVAAQAETGDTP